MRKRRRLANKMTMMVCAVLIAVFAFFYAPMEVSAAEVYQGYVNSVSGRVADFSYLFSDSYGTFDNNVVYELNYTVSGDIIFDSPCYLRSISVNYGGVGFFISNRASNGAGSMNIHSFDYSGIRYLKGNFLNSSDFVVNASCIGLPNGFNNFTSSLSIDMNSITPLTGEESASYQQGYNAGYSAGETAGESNGYSNGYSDGYEAGEQSGYDIGFQAGADSVDTQSYYDAGYSAGYDAGYASGYDDGYDDGFDDGWQAYEDKISGWGADTSDYPVYITSSSSELGFLSGYVYGNSQVYDEESIILNFDINPNHIYRFDVKLGVPKQASSSNVYGAYTAVYFCAGGIDYFISPTVNYGEGIYKSIYVRGDMLSSSFSKKGVVNVVSSSVTNPGMPAFYSFTDFWHDIQVYDVGPIGNMQNYIANQTDQLTGGYNDSQGNSVNNDFSLGLNEFETAEDSLFATATTGLKDFTFFDFESVPAMVTGMSFVGSIMGSWFSQAGGASGVGIVLSILFSIMLVAMVLGLYRWYQSKGGKD